MVGMKGCFYNIEFIDELDMDTWCELYNVTRDVFDILDCDDNGSFHAVFSSVCVPKYHKEQIKLKKESEYGEDTNGRVQRGHTKRPNSKSKKIRSESPYEQFILR